MGIRYYDTAIYNKIQSWIKDPNMRILKPNETTRLFQMRADQNSDAPIKLPLIAISRESNIEVLHTKIRPLSFDGKHLANDDIQTLQLNAIPISVVYQLDIYTRKFEEGDEYLRNFIFNFVNFPKLEITLPYNNTNVVYNAYLDLLSTVTDNSDISEKLFADQFTRWTLQLELKDGYLFSIPFRDNWSIEEADLRIMDVDEKGVTTNIEDELVEKNE